MVGDGLASGVVALALGDADGLAPSRMLRPSPESSPQADVTSATVARANTSAAVRRTAPVLFISSLLGPVGVISPEGTTGSRNPGAP